MDVLVHLVLAQLVLASCSRDVIKFSLKLALMPLSLENQAGERPRVERTNFLVSSHRQDERRKNTFFVFWLSNLWLSFSNLQSIELLAEMHISIFQPAQSTIFYKTTSPLKDSEYEGIKRKKRYFFFRKDNESAI